MSDLIVLTDHEIAAVSGGDITVTGYQSNSDTVTQTGTVVGGPPVVNVSNIIKRDKIFFGSPALAP